MALPNPFAGEYTLKIFPITGEVSLGKILMIDIGSRKFIAILSIDDTGTTPVIGDAVIGVTTITATNLMLEFEMKDPRNPLETILFKEGILTFENESGKDEIKGNFRVGPDATGRADDDWTATRPPAG